MTVASCVGQIGITLAINDIETKWNEKVKGQDQTDRTCCQEASVTSTSRELVTALNAEKKQTRLNTESKIHGTDCAQKDDRAGSIARGAQKQRKLRSRLFITANSDKK